MDDDLVIRKYITIKLDKAIVTQLEAMHGKPEAHRVIKEEIVRFMNESFEKYVEEETGIQE